MATEPQDEVLPLTKLRQALALCRTGTMGCAFGLTRDKKNSLLLVAKGAKPQALATALMSDGKNHLDPSTLRFGHVRVDSVRDPGTLRFTVNRSEAGGTITALNKLIKRAGYSGLAIDAEPPAKEPAQSNQPAKSPANPSAKPSDKPSAAPPEPPPTDAPVDLPALRDRLAALLEQVTARQRENPEASEALVKLAKTTRIRLATNNVKTAASLMDQLEDLLDNRPPEAADNPQADPASDTPPNPNQNPELNKLDRARDALAPALARAADVSPALANAIEDADDAFRTALADGDPAAARRSLIELATLSKRVAAADDGIRPGRAGITAMRFEWESARRTAAADLAALIRDADADVSDAARQVDLMLARFDAGLVKLLDRLAKSSSDIERGKAIMDALKAINAYLGYLARDPLLWRLDTDGDDTRLIARGTLAAPLEALRVQIADLR